MTGGQLGIHLHGIPGDGRAHSILLQEARDAFAYLSVVVHDKDMRWRSHGVLPRSSLHRVSWVEL